MTSDSELELVLCYTRPSLRKPPTENVDRLACEAAQNGDGALPLPEPSMADLASSLLTERNKLPQCPGYVQPIRSLIEESLVQAGAADPSPSI